MTPKQPLSGLRVLAFEQFGAGPYGSLYLSDLGAEVIKIENAATGGDPARSTGQALADGDSAYFQTFNMGKRSITLDMKSEVGRAQFKELAATADIVWNNLRGNQPAKLGLTFDALKESNPKVICAHISAYGRDNDRADWPGYDYLMQAECGFLDLTGEPDAPPARFGLSMIDFMTGVVAGMATLGALFARDRDGGCDVDVSLFDVALHQLSYPGAWYLNHGTRTGRIARSAHPANTPVQLYKTADGWIFLMCMTQKFWQFLIEAIERPELNDDPRFSTIKARTSHRDALTPILDEILSTRPTAEWLSRLNRNVPAAPVYDLPSALDNPFVHDIGMIQSIDHPEFGEYRSLASPMKIDGERPQNTLGGALGADNEKLL